MAILPESSDYTDLDKTALDARVQALVQSAWSTWSDFARVNFANLLNELSTWVGDVLQKYQNRQALEAFVAWAIQRKSMLALAKLVGYAPRGAVAAQYEETFTIAATTAGDVVFPVGTTVRTSAVTDPVVCQLLEEVTIAAGSTSATGTIENSVSEVDTFTSDGTPGQQFTLTATGYLDSSLSLVFGGDTYTQVENFFSSLATDKHFTVWVDENDRCQFTLGDGVNGRVPAPETTGTATYKTGGGLTGNVEAHTINAIDGTWTDELGTSVSVTVDNAATATVLGEDRQTVEAMRLLVPASVRAPSRCISREDFEISALLVPGVGRALMLSTSELDGIPETEGWLYIVPTGGGAPSETLKDLVTDCITVTRPGPIGISTTVEDPVYLTINVHVKAWPRAGYAAATMAAAIRTALADWFAPCLDDGTPNSNVDFGWNLKDEDGLFSGLVALSDLYNVVRDVSSVLRLGTATADFTLNGAHDNIAILAQQFPALGTVTITNGATGGAL